MKVKDITSVLEQWAPLAYQESYDNCGLLIGDSNSEVSGVLITLDITEEVLLEAINENCNLVISHHPLIFNGLKKISSDHWVDKCVQLAIKQDLNLYAIHTNLDNVKTGVNKKIADLIGLTNQKILSPKSDSLLKLETFVPPGYKEALLAKLYEAGAGEIGEYSNCSFQLNGSGTFKPSEHANPTIGTAKELETVEETKIEILIPYHLQHSILQELRSAHPYEEVAYYLTPISNRNQEIGSGMIGELPTPMKTADFLDHLKKQLNLEIIKHTPIVKDEISSVALCGGSGSFLLPIAKRSKADTFITSDVKYHDFFEADGEIIFADIGHYESEIFTKDLIRDFLTQKFANIAFRLSGVVTNPVKIS